MQPEFSKYTKIATQAALAAGEVLRESYGKQHTITEKEGHYNLVTDSDFASEKLILSMIRKEFPEHQFIAEESGASAEGNSPFQWIIDPLDGTVNFARNLPVFAVSIALAKQGEVILGVIYQPLLRELFVAEKGKGAFLNNTPLKVTETKTFDTAILATGFPYNVKDNPGKCIDQFTHFIEQGLPLRRMGSAALDLAYVAAGRYDAFWEVFLSPWDYAAGALLVQEACGLCSRFDGTPLNLSSGPILASNTHLHSTMIKNLRAI
ncbi:MAG: inositol monophosphatase [Simkaniaceae bacterium]|nr:inositol monophosphatase [Simkaniaceae bacterium]